PQFTQHMNTILPINPGIAGSAGICASLHYRQQWAGFYDLDTNGVDKYKTAPRDIMLLLHAPVKALHGGLGLTVYNDAYGFQKDITVKLAYSFRMNIGGGVLGVGPSIDLLSRKIDDSHWLPGSSGDPDLINNMGKTDMYFDASFGAYYEMQNKWYAGVSSTQLISAIGGDKIYQKASRHMYFFGGYSFEVPSNPNWELKPCALIKTDFKSAQIDATMIAEWSGMYWVGASYRAIDAVAILGGARPFINSTVAALRGLEVTLSYDINTSKMMREGRSFGGPEVSVKYCFKIVHSVPPEAYRNSRQLGNIPIEYRR
ncbi:MAG: type IX secretion system membrane protein PorP/SprF, partial [Lentimicrobiaceae bacterium]|nr:type IX secretion system membrane protein PorP/SprF [Lentimicrobiaceae bacterium]